MGQSVQKLCSGIEFAVRVFQVENNVENLIVLTEIDFKSTFRVIFLV